MKRSLIDDSAILSTYDLRKNIGTLVHWGEEDCVFTAFLDLPTLVPTDFHGFRIFVFKINYWGPDLKACFGGCMKDFQ